MPGEQVGSAYVSIGLDDSKLESGLNAAKGKVSSAVGGMGSAIGSALKTGVVAGTAALAGIATVGLKSFKDLESAASSAASKAVDVNGKTTEEIKAQYDSLQSHIISVSNELGASTIFNPTEVAQTYDVLAAKGANVAAIGKNELIPFLDLAAATQSDLASVTDLVAGSINSFGLEMSDSATVADQIAMALNGSGASMETLNYALRQGGATASATGMQLGEFNAIVGVLADKQYTGEQSGAALKTAMLALYTPTKKQNETMEKLGITYDQVNPRTHKFMDTLELLISKGADIGDFGNMFTDSSGAIMYALAGAGDEVDSLNAKISNSSGLAHTQASLIMDTTKLVGAWETAKGAAEGMTTAIGQALEPAAVKLLNIWTQMAPKIQEFSVALASGNWEEAGALIEKGIRAGFEKLKDLGEKLLEWLKGVDYGAIASYITDKIKAGWEALKDLGSQLLEWLKGVNWAGVATTITEAIKSGWETLKALGEDLAGWIKDYDWEKLAEDIGGLIKAGWKKVKDWAKDIIAGLKADWDAWIAADGPKELGWTLARAIAEGAKDAGKWIYDKIASWWKSNGSSLGGAIAAAIDFAKSAAQAAWDFAKSFGSTLLTAGKGTIGASILEVIGNAMNSAWDGAGESLITRAKEWRDNAEALFAAEDFEAYVEYIGTGDNPYDVEDLDIDLPIKYHISKSGDAFYVVSDENNAEHGTQRGQVFKSATTAAFAVENAAKALGVSTTKLDDATQRAAATETKAAATITAKYKSTSEKANALTMGVFQTSTQALLAAAMQGAQATQQAATATSAAAAMAVDRILNGSQTAANAIQQGAQVAANFTTQAGQAVKIGLDASGREIAVIGQVAQQRFTQAGGELYNKVQVAGSGFQNSVQSGANAIQSGANAVNGAANNLAGAASNAASSLANAYASFARNNPYSGNASPSYPISQTISFSSSSSSKPSSSSSSSSNPSWWNAAYVAAGGRAKGTETTGPELAIIGEAGREWVIPEKHKRWDLLLAAMRAYGITGMAEGGAAGSSGATEATDADEMRAYFGIKGLASMSKQVQKIITDLKNFFRISWGIIKAEGSTYWRQINQIISQEATTTRDGAWQAAIDIRNTWLSSNAQILADVKTSYEAIWPTISPSLESLRSSAVMTFEGINGDVANVMMSLSMNWSGVWDEMLLKLSDAQNQISSAVSTISTQLASISMNTSINISSSGGGGGSYSSGGGGGGGAGGMDWGFAGSDDWLAPTGDWSEYGGSSSINCGANCNIGCEGIYNNAVISSTGPLATAGLGVDLMNSGYGGSYGGGGGSFGSSTWSGLPAIFRARGALIDKGPELSIVGEAGPELILPANITRTIMNLADMGLGSLSGKAGRIVIEDHTVHRWYMDGKEVTNLLMDKAVRQLRLKGASPVR